MNDFEDRLREALQRREPPSGFAERVVALVPQRRAPMWTRWRSVAAIAAVLLVMFSALLYERHRANQAEAANRQLMYALRLAARQIERVQNRVQNSSAVVKVDRDEVKGDL
jgi:hypothetical protein